MFRTPAAALSVGLALALALTGCGGVTPNADSGSGSGSGDTTDTSGSTEVTLPDGFPSDEVPIIDGTIVAANHPGNIWAVWVASDDLAGDMEAATTLLLNAGYANVITTDEYRNFHGTKWQVHVTAKDDPTYGSTIAYSFYEVQ